MMVGVDFVCSLLLVVIPTEGHRAEERSLCSVRVVRRAAVHFSRSGHMFVVLPKTHTTNSAFPSVSAIEARESAYLTKSVL